MSLGWERTTLRSLLAAIDDRTLTPSEVLDHYLTTSQALNPSLNACMELFEPSDEPSAQGALRGVPFAIKDNIAIAGSPTTAGSLALADNTAALDASVVARLKASGAFIAARTNLDEFAFGGDSASPVGGVTRNPWPGATTPGGSSGGAAAAVAAGMVAAAIGSDTAGSIRNPASHCGLVGLRSRRRIIDAVGLVPLAPSLDVVGILGRTVEDVALVLDFVAPSSSSHSQLPVDDFRLGVATEAVAETDPSVRAVLHAAISRIRMSGTQTGDVSLPWLDASLAATLAVMLVEAAATWGERLEARRELVGEDVRPLFDLGSIVPARSYHRACLVRDRIREDVGRFLNTFDAILMPVSGRDIRLPDRGTESVLQKSVRFTAPWSLADFTALALPAGWTSEGMPVGLQIIGRDERTVLRVASVLEERLQVPLTIPDAVSAAAAL